MKGKLYILSFFIACHTGAYAQSCADNLVPNPSFEDTLVHIHNPVYFENLERWSAPNYASPDLYHYCNNWDYSIGQGACSPFISDIYMGMPNNWFGYQFALNGLSYVGIVLYAEYPTLVPSKFYREYIQCKVNSSLKPCVDYQLFFYVSLSDTSNYALSELQVAITKDSLFAVDDWIIDYIVPTYTGPGYAITDTSSWTMLSFTFTAEGGEEWVTIGNFSSRYDTSLVRVRDDGMELSYYYIDMVSLCEVPKPAQEIPNIITPNGDGLNDVFYVMGLYPGSRLRVYNRWGAEVFDAEVYANNWAGTSKTLGSENKLPDGVYFYVLESHCGGRQTGTITLAGGM